MSSYSDSDIKSTTVFMPIFNSQRFLVEAIESILSQSYSQFELLLVDGGSTDLTLVIAREFAKKDGRIRIIERPNTTPVQRFNEMLGGRNSKYFVLAHSDDIQHKDRLKNQIEFMESHPAIAMCGSNTFYWLHNFASEWGKSYSSIGQYPSRNEDIKFHLLFWWSFANPSLCFRSEVFQAESLFLCEQFRFAADYLLYWKISGVGEVANLEKPLMGYRHHSSSEGPQNQHLVREEMLTIRRIILQESGLWERFSEHQREVFLRLEIEAGTVVRCPDRLKDYESIFLSIKQHYCADRNYAALCGCIEHYRFQILEQLEPVGIRYFRRKGRGLRRRLNRWRQNEN